jgi:uncharacterized phage protein (TIGR02220 family)
MSKDPAVLFYTGDFLVGTMKMNYAQKGKYIQLLCLQHQDGHLSEDDMLSVCGDYDEKIFSKFVKDENGRYYNERMEQESIKRRRFVESRQRNLVKTDKEVQVEDHKEHHMEAHMANHTESRMENENINENINDIKDIIDYLNIALNTKYRYTTKSIQTHIRARLREGFTVDDFKCVIDKKRRSWMGTDFQKYLRPDTLFGSKFQSYLNEIERESSFDADDFFQAALARQWG